MVNSLNSVGTSRVPCMELRATAVADNSKVVRVPTTKRLATVGMTVLLKSCSTARQTIGGGNLCPSALEIKSEREKNDAYLESSTGVAMYAFNSSRISWAEQYGANAGLVDTNPAAAASASHACRRCRAPSSRRPAAQQIRAV